MFEIPFKRILLHPATLFVGCVILTVAGSVALWEQNAHHFLSSDKYKLTPDRIVVQGERDDLANQLKAEIVRQLSEAKASTLDPKLVSQIVAITDSQPYVQTSFVKKSVSSLNVSASFRRPAAVIELENMPIAVDANGVLLDGRIYNLQTPDDLLRISIYKPADRGLNTWETWPDTRVVAAAKVCEELKDVWQEFKLYRVVSYWEPGKSPRASDVFELWTKYGDKIIWSNAIPTNSAATAEQKIAAIRKFIEEKGSLDNLAGRNKLDVRSGEAILTKDVRTAERNRLLISRLQNLFFPTRSR